MTEPELEALLASARAAEPAPSDALMARVMADAAALQPRLVARAPASTPSVSSGVLARLAALFGGGGALAGVSLALVAGVFVGVVQPAPVAALTQALLPGTDIGTVDLLPGAADLWEVAADD